MSTCVWPSHESCHFVYNMVDTNISSINMIRNKICKRLSNIAKNIAAGCMLPMGYVWLPLSCCYLNPVVKYALDGGGDDDDDAICNNLATKTVEVRDGVMAYRDAEPGIEMFAINTGGMFVGLMSTVTGCCCLGCCGTYAPSDMF
jgi:hypothetical protein